MLHRLIFWSLLLGCAAFALLRGGAPERWAAGIMLAGCAMTPLVLAPMAQRFNAVEWGGLAVDVAVYVAFTGLAVVANRFWPIWLSAMQGVVVATHAIGLLPSTIWNLTYAILVQMWIYPMMAMLVVGTVRHRLRRARTGVDRSWKSSFAPSTRGSPATGPNAS